jgi:hypothetical protein
MSGRPIAFVPRRSLRGVTRLIIVGVLALAALLLGLREPASAAPACDKTWTRNAGSLWTAGGSWSPSGVPTTARSPSTSAGSSQRSAHDHDPRRQSEVKRRSSSSRRERLTTPPD